MYPQTVVPSGDTLHTTLTNGMDVPGSGVTFTGKHYTANKDATAWSDGVNEELNLVYEYQGKRYVRVTPYSRQPYNESTYPQYTYNYSTVDNPDPIGQSGFRWFKVEPIKWIILNINIFEDKDVVNGIITDLGLASAPEGATLELYAADVLMSGIQFNPDTIASGLRTVWDQSSIYKYLNEIFYKEAFPMTYIPKSTIYNNTGDGTISSFSDPVYNLNVNHLQSGGMNPSSQNIYLLSYYELQNEASPYVTANPVFEDNSGAASESRRVSGTDYARSHYLYLEKSGTTFHPHSWTRTVTPGPGVYLINTMGGFGYNSATLAHYGTRPALPMLRFTLLKNYSCNLSKQKSPVTIWQSDSY